MTRIKIILIALLFSHFLNGQGRNNIWLLGYNNFTDQYTTSSKATLDFMLGFPQITTTTRKMKFLETQGNISDGNGNLLMSSNGIWIANANGDTMLNGSGLNPNSFTASYASSSIASLPIPFGNVIIPYPDDINKYVLFHMTGNNNANLASTELYYSIIDITLDSGLGSVIQKNIIACQDTFSYGIGSCKHANGRDWWITCVKDNSNKIYSVLLTPNGVDTVIVQQFSSILTFEGSVGQPIFSPNGEKFAFTTSHFIGGTLWETNIKYFNFDRCSGTFVNYQTIAIHDGSIGLGSAFSQNSKYLYACTTTHIFQVNTDSLLLNPDTVATFDGYFSPVSPWADIFWLMHLAPDHKIYLSSGNAVVDLHVINSPDSSGLLCDVQQHSLHIPCYHLGSVPNHPNYFLGPVTGSICDSIPVGINFIPKIKGEISISPNPADFMITINANNIFGKKVVLRIYNSIGKEMGSREVGLYGDGYLSQDIYVGALAPDIYIVKLEGENAVYTSRFVKQ